MTDQLFGILLQLWMSSDPWPLSEDEQNRFEAELMYEATKRGFVDHLDAFHRFVVDDVKYECRRVGNVK